MVRPKSNDMFLEESCVKTQKRGFYEDEAEMGAVQLSPRIASGHLKPGESLAESLLPQSRQKQSTLMIP